eukprot:4442697-Pyramimonas_sp.AAC.2
MRRNDLPPHGRFEKPPAGRSSEIEGMRVPPPPAMAPQLAAMTNNTGCLLMDFRGLDTGGAEFPDKRKHALSCFDALIALDGRHVTSLELHDDSVANRDRVTAPDLADHFGNFGPVECVCIRQQGLAYVNMVVGPLYGTASCVRACTCLFVRRELDGEGARAGLNRFPLGGSPLTVEYEVDVLKQLQKGEVPKDANPRPGGMPPKFE